MQWPPALRAIVVAGIVLVLVLPFLLFKDQLLEIFAAREQVVAEVRAAGAWGPLVIMALTIGQTIVAPIPGQAVHFVSAYIFGFWPGMLYSWIGQVLGAALAMLLARYAGRPLVERLVSPQLLARVDRAVAGRGVSFFFLFFLIPGLPDDVLCFVAGLTPLPLRVLIVLSAVARIPGLIGAAWLGAYAAALPWPVWLVFALLSILALYFMWRYGARAQELLLNWLGRR